MFKAKIIEGDDYYKLKADQLFLSILPALPMAAILHFCDLSIMQGVIAITTYIVCILAIQKNKRLTDALIGKRRIEIDQNQIRIKTKKGQLEETIEVNDLREIGVLENYFLSAEASNEFTVDLDEEIKKNYIEINRNGIKRRFDFELDSHYMIVQLTKVIEAWKAQGKTVKIVKMAW